MRAAGHLLGPGRETIGGEDGGGQGGPVKASGGGGCPAWLLTVTSCMYGQRIAQASGAEAKRAPSPFVIFARVRSSG